MSVFKAENVRDGSPVAIKVSRAGKKYSHFASSEIRVLKTIQANGGNDKKRFVNLLDNFECLGHQFLVFELLSVSLYGFLVDNCYAPFPNSQIQSVTRQILAGLACKFELPEALGYHTDMDIVLKDLKIIHADLKPDNIVLCNKQYQTFIYDRTVVSTLFKKHFKSVRRVLLNPEIRLIDFGLASFDDEPNMICDTALAYSAPEVRLRRGSSFPRDMWSLGCLILHLRTGEFAFPYKYTSTSIPRYIALVEAVTGSKIDDAWLNEIGQNIKFDSTPLELSRKKLKTQKINDLDVSAR
ncbi:unnamed protein product [Fusarium graminearum]|nr:unnamed protein product [Fusarium graminearum]